MIGSFTAKDGVDIYASNANRAAVVKAPRGLKARSAG